jgi:hypothetical protein
MVIARIHSITWIRSRDYEVVFDFDGETKSMMCSVLEYEGVRVVESHGGLTLKLRTDPRLVAAAVLAFDAVREDARAAVDPSGETG